MTARPVVAPTLLAGERAGHVPRKFDPKGNKMLRDSIHAMAFAAILAAPANAEAPRAFDVAEDLPRFADAESHRYDDGMAEYGNARHTLLVARVGGGGTGTHADIDAVMTPTRLGMTDGFGVRQRLVLGDA